MTDSTNLANLLALFAIAPLCAAGGSLLIPRFQLLPRLHTHSLAALLAGIVNLILALWLMAWTVRGTSLVLHMGGHHGPFGIVLVGDVFAALLLLLTAVIYLGAVPFAIDVLDQRDRMGFYPLSLFLLMGVNGTFLAGDLFNLYVFFEILVITSFVLVTLGGQRDQIRGGLRFVVLNLLGSMVFLGAVAVAYGTLGTLNFAHIAVLLREPNLPTWLAPIMAGLLFVAFAGKSALFPLHFWLPCSYHTTHPVVNALFGGLLTKVGLYSLFRLFPLLFPEQLAAWQPAFLTLAGASMVVGTLGGLSGDTLRRALSFQIISHIGFIFAGLALAGARNEVLAAGLAPAILYLAHHMIVKTAVLMAGGAVELELRTGRVVPGPDGGAGGLLTRRRWLAIWFFLTALSLAGIPPFSGFAGKLGLLLLMVSMEQWLLLAVAVLSSFVTLYMIMRLWQGAFWGPSPTVHDGEGPTTARTRLGPGFGILTLAPIAVLVGCSLLMGVFGEGAWRVANQAAIALTDTNTYIDSVALTAHLVEAGH